MLIGCRLYTMLCCYDGSQSKDIIQIIYRYHKNKVYIVIQDYIQITIKTKYT